MMRYSLCKTFGSAVLLAVAAGAFTGPVAGSTTRPAGKDTMPADARRAAERAVDRAMKWYVDTQGPRGGWFEKAGPAITAIIADCFLRHPDYGQSSPVTGRALAFVLTFQQPDGGIYQPGTFTKNYEASIALMALSRAKGEQYEQAAGKVKDFLIGIQFKRGMNDREGNVIDENHAYYGGSGYGEHKRPDLSNTQMMIEALRQAGVSPDDSALRRAVEFLSRCQMLSSTNDQPFARKASGKNAGGFIYTVADTDENRSKAGYVGEGARRQLRTYGSMTYAGFKSLLYAKVPRDDPRVQAAWRWIQNFYDLDHNPNMPDKQRLEGLYYYYHVFAKAMRAWGEPTLVDAKGQAHNWRVDLCRALVKRQREDGTWVNDADRWMEGLPQLVTAYSVMALQEALAPAE